MRVFLNLKLWAILAVLFSLNSCLDDDTKTLGITYTSPFILQNPDGTFTPQVRLYGANLKSAVININDKPFALTALNDFMWEVPETGTGLDSIPAGYYFLTATNHDGKSEQLLVSFDGAKNKIGEVITTKFEYNEINKKIQIELADTVENAGFYYLMAKPQYQSSSGMDAGFSMWIPYTEINFSIDGSLSAEISLSDLDAGLYRFAVGANYGSTVRVGEVINVEIKKSLSGN